MFQQLQFAYKFATTTVIHTLEPEICEDAATMPLHMGTLRISRFMPIGAYVALPLESRGDSLGALLCISPRPRHFTPYELEFLRTVCAQLSLAMLVAQATASHARSMDSGARLMRQACLTEDSSEERRLQSLESLFLELSGAQQVCALGFARDVPTSHVRLLDLACRACESNEQINEDWQQDGAALTVAGISVEVSRNRRASVAAAWSKSKPRSTPDKSLLVTFAYAWLMATEARRHD